MGNLCSKRRLKYSKDEIIRYHLDDILKKDRKFKACQEKVKFIQTGAVKDTNNLELYLNDVFEKECVFEAEQGEVGFIQSGIETLVQKIVELVLEKFISKYEGFEDYIRHFGCKSLIENHSGELYFPIKAGDEFVEVRSARCPIIKVGSFYERTKNTFPDEFDFIFLLFSVAPLVSLGLDCRNINEYFKACYRTNICIKETLTACNKEALKYVSPHGALHRDRELYFDRYVMEHGPASMLRFIYNNGSMEERYINVDLVPAYTVDISQGLVTSKFLPNWTNQEMPKSFREDLESEKYCLGVTQGLSFTETEVRYMKNVLSQKHVKVYRILKFLINGHGDDEILNTYKITFKLGKGYSTGYSSYHMKIMMITHHDECANTSTEHIGPCVIQVLEAMCQYNNSDDFPKWYHFGIQSNLYKIFTLLPILQFLTRKLKSLQFSEDSYHYEKVRMKSVTRQYLDILDRAVPEIPEYLDSLGDAEPCRAGWLQY